MITKPTVLILGAGASMPYGFPSGEELVMTIDKNLNPRKLGSHPNPDWIAILKNFGILEKDIHTFRQELLYSRLSIDSFLGHQPKFLKVGKLAITLSLIQYENENNLFPDINKDLRIFQRRLSSLFNRCLFSFFMSFAGKVLFAVFSMAGVFPGKRGMGPTQNPGNLPERYTLLP